VLDVASQVIAWAAGVATVLALPFAAGGYARQWPASYRRATSWLLAGLGSLLALGAAGWLAAGRLPLSQGQGLIIAGVGAAGALLAIGGATRAVRTPADPALRVLRALADVVERHLDSLDEGTGFDRRRFVELAVGIAPSGRRRRTSLDRALSTSSAQMLVLAGDSGAGKSVLLRELARQTCRRVQRKKRPRRFAVYVDMASLPDRTAESITADVVRAHIKTLTVGDSELTAALDRQLRAPNDRPEWWFLFDSFDEMPVPSGGEAAEVVTRQYLDAIRQVLSSGGPSFRAVIGTRDPSNLSLAGPVLTVAPLSPRQQREIGRNAELDPGNWPRVRHRLRHDPALGPVAGNPLLLALLCDYLRDADLPEIPPTLHEIIGAAVEARLLSVSDSTASADVMRHAEHIARCLTSGMALETTPWSRAPSAGTSGDDPVDEVGDEAALRLLVEARIGRVERPGRFAFTHRRFEEYFAASWLLRCWDRNDTDDLASDTRWREPVITALGIGSDRLRGDLIAAAARVLKEETALAAGTLAVVEPLTRLGPREPLPPAVTPFSWPPVALHILQMLALGLSSRRDEVPEEIRTAADWLVVTAFATGTRADQERAIAVSTICTTEVALWVAERSATSGSALLTVAAAEQITATPHVFARLGGETRARVVGAAAMNPLLVNKALAQRASADLADQTLSGSVRDLVLTGRVSAAGFVILGVSALVSETPGPLSSLGVFLMAVILAAVLFLGTWSGQHKGPTELANFAGICVIVTAVLAAFRGVLHLIVAAVLLVTGMWAGALHGAFFGYLETWPTSIVIVIMTGLRSERRDWVFPQQSVVQMTGRAIPWQRMPLAAAKALRSLAALAIPAGLLVAVAVVPLPRMKPQQSANVRGWLAVGVIAVLCVVVYSWRRRRLRSQMQAVGRWLSARTVTGEAVLGWLREARTKLATERLLAELAESARGSLLPAIDALTDLARALEHVVRLVPEGTTKVIPPGVWEVGPGFSRPEFRQWLILYDKRYPGRLAWLAATQRDTLALALERAEPLRPGRIGN
jgi:NACHT domain